MSNMNNDNNEVKQDDNNEVKEDVNNQLERPDANAYSNPNKRGKYIIISPSHKLLLAKEVDRTSVSECMANHPRLKLKYTTLVYWCKQYKRGKATYGTVLLFLYMRSF